MGEDDLYYINLIPTETLTSIFLRLPAYELTTCRAVCIRWQIIIDEMTSTEILWRDQCKKHFPDIYESAYRKSSPRLTWYFLYRSLEMWSKVNHSQDTRKIFAKANYFKDEIHDFVIIPSNEIIVVHTAQSIVSYDRNTLQIKQGSKVEGTCCKYSESENFYLTLHDNYSLLIKWKSITTSNSNIINCENVVSFIHDNNVIYYVTKYRKIHKCALVSGKVTDTELVEAPGPVVTLSFKNGCLHILSHINIYKLVRNKLFDVMRLDPTNVYKIYHALKTYNFLQEMSYTHYKALITQYYGPTIPPMAITKIFPYGVVTFVGHINGKLFIYYTPDSDDLTDLFRDEPLKVYDFVQDDDPIGLYPIIQIDIVENVDSHTLFVATIKRITVVNITHEFARPPLLNKPDDNSEFRNRSSSSSSE